jgi:hypothetical protein
MNAPTQRNTPPGHTGPDALLRNAQGALVVEPALQGRSGGMKNVKREYMFCQLASGLVDQTTVNDFVDLSPGWSDSSNRQDGSVIARNCDRLWLVNARGIEVYRTSADGLNPLGADIVINGPLPAGASRSLGLHAYRLRVKVMTPSEFAVYEIDANQDAEFYGQAVEVNLIGPSNAVSIPSNAVLETFSRNNFVVDSVVACSIYPIETSRCCDCYLTEFLRSPANTASVIRVPRGARELKIYQGNPGAAAPALRWTRFIGDPTVVAAIDVGGLNFVQRESIDNSFPIGEESHLQTDIEPVNARLFVLRWTIRP